MKYSTAALKEKIRSWFAEPQGKARIACQVFAVLLGLAALLMIIASVAYGSVIGLLVSLLVAPLLILLPFYFYHFSVPCCTVLPTNRFGIASVRVRPKNTIICLSAGLFAVWLFI